MTQPLISNFSIPADNDHDAILTIKSDVAGDSLSGCTVYWRAFEQSFGVPVPNIPPVLDKNSLSGGDVVILPSPPMTVRISFRRAETAALLRNYYHEVTVIDEILNQDTVTVGIMTVTQTENRIP